MGRPVVQAILALLLTLALTQSSKGEANDVKQIDLTKQSDEIQASFLENSVFRVARDARRRSQSSRKGNNLNKKKPDKERKKLRNTKKNGTKNKKMGRSRKNRMKQKNKRKKNEKQLRKTKKKRTKKWKKSRTMKNKPKKDNKKSRQNKKKSGQKQKSKFFQEKKKKNELSKWEPKEACDEAALCQKIKDYIKISNQLRKVRRIIKSCDTMDRKANKSASEFEATVTALETAIGSSSGRRMYRSRWRRASEADDVTSIKDKLKNCSITAKAKCQKSSVAPCQEEANLTKCETELKGWLTKFGPAKGSCLQASADCCACITALPDVSKDCLAFDKKSTIAVDSKKKCTGGDEEGSFGFCKKLQIEAAEKGPKHAKDNCKHTMTTKSPKPTGTFHIFITNKSNLPVTGSITYSIPDGHGGSKMKSITYPVDPPVQGQEVANGQAWQSPPFNDGEEIRMITAKNKDKPCQSFNNSDGTTATRYNVENDGTTKCKVVKV